MVGPDRDRDSRDPASRDPASHDPASHDPARHERGGLERLLAERGDHLLRASIALTGSRADGEELLQAALERLVRNWRRASENPEGYLRRTLVNLAADDWRHRIRWRRKLHLLREETASPGDTATVDLRDELIRLLRQLPPRQRAVIVLRYWEQRTQAEVADLLGCSEGTVKSTASRAMRKLRELLAAAGHDTGPSDRTHLVEEKS
jgi:RNA polymerase sigma-70 factor (sigma-E family)